MTRREIAEKLLAKLESTYGFEVLAGDVELVTDDIEMALEEATEIAKS